MPNTPAPAPAPTPAQQQPDLAEQILRSAQGIDDNIRADAWDAFHQSNNEDELATRLQNLNLPQAAKADLWDAKRYGVSIGSTPVNLKTGAGAEQAAMSQVQSKWEPNPGDAVYHIQTSDGKHWHLHADDLREAQKRDPGLKVHGSFIAPTPEERARQRTLLNMTAAMSGQPMENPEDQARAEEGRESGTIWGAATLAGEAAGGLFTPGVKAVQETSSLFGPEGQPIAREVLKKTPSIARGVISAVKDALPKEATVDQAVKIARIVYHLGLGTGGAAFLWHELFGGK